MVHIERRKKCRCIQPLTQELDSEGRITGYVNRFGVCSGM
jgi:hypothetical protein